VPPTHAAQTPATLERVTTPPRSAEEARDADGHIIRELHGVTLAMIVEDLVRRFGWKELARRIPINCFAKDPSVKSSLTFLRRTPWARKKVEELYVRVRTAEVRGEPAPEGRDSPLK
jgi:uncharacterized protein (DUF2132 family)